MKIYARPVSAFQLAGTTTVLDPNKVYEANPATNQPDSEGKVFIEGVLLCADEYVIVPDPYYNLRIVLASIHFDPWNLSGPGFRLSRQRLMELVTGEKRPVAKCGVNALCDELEKRFPHRHLATCRANEPEALKQVLSAL